MIHSVYLVAFFATAVSLRNEDEQLQTASAKANESKSALQALADQIDGSSAETRRGRSASFNKLKGITRDACEKARTYLGSNEVNYPKLGLKEWLQNEQVGTNVCILAGNYQFGWTRALAAQYALPVTEALYAEQKTVHVGCTDTQQLIGRTYKGTVEFHSDGMCDKEWKNGGLLDITDVSENRTERQKHMLEKCDAAITLAGGPGVADEAFQMETAGKPVLPILGTTGVSDCSPSCLTQKVISNAMQQFKTSISAGVNDWLEKKMTNEKNLCILAGNYFAGWQENTAEDWADVVVSALVDKKINLHVGCSDTQQLIGSEYARRLANMKLEGKKPEAKVVFYSSVECATEWIKPELHLEKIKDGERLEWIRPELTLQHSGNTKQIQSEGITILEIRTDGKNDEDVSMMLPGCQAVITLAGGPGVWKELENTPALTNELVLPMLGTGGTSC